MDRFHDIAAFVDLEIAKGLFVAMQMYPELVTVLMRNDELAAVYYMTRALALAELHGELPVFLSTRNRFELLPEE
ncbi:MAG: hypothetical protein HC893_14455 [Chloroflexaceae bacterium]|nr:hypothetical protein [Chloroflexaceae bacterium]